MVSLADTSVHRAFQGFSGFTSGIGVHYAPSLITRPTHQSLASGLIVGQRFPPHVFLRAADARPFEIQDLMPSDTRFKIMAFVGDITDESQMQRVQALAEQLENSSSFYRRLGGGDPAKAFDILAISSASKEEVNYTDVPAIFRPHWSKCAIFNFLVPVLG